MRIRWPITPFLWLHSSVVCHLTFCWHNIWHEKPYSFSDPEQHRLHSRLGHTVATPEPSLTRSASPNRNPGTLDLFLFIFRVIKFSFSKIPRPESSARPNGGSEPEPGLLRRFHLSYQNILLCHFVAEADSVLGKPIIIYKSFIISQYAFLMQ